MAEKSIRVMVKEPFKPVVEKVLPNTLQAFQESVGGYIEVVRHEEAQCLMVVNEEGKFSNLKFNFRYNGDFIMGTAVFVSDDLDEFGSLTEDQIERLKITFDEGR